MRSLSNLLAYIPDATPIASYFESSATLFSVTSSDDLWDIGWEDYLDRNGIAAVEWSENISDALEDAIVITIHKTGETSRRIEIEGGEDLADLSI